MTALPTGINRDHAWSLVQEYVQNDGLRLHMRGVELAVRAYAKKMGEDEELWGIVGLLHDFDYERWPDPPDHPLQGERILKSLGYPDEITYAIKSHADYLPDCPRVKPLHHVLYACDELCGFISACALVRPDGIHGMTASSVRKKMKSKGFARNVSRDDMERGAAAIGVDFPAHIDFVIAALAPHAVELKLDRGLVESSGPPGGES